MLSRSAREYFGFVASAVEARRRPRRLSPRLESLEGRQLLTIAVEIRYDDDTSHFFDTQAKKDVMQQVADQLGASLSDHLAAISPSGSNTWTARFINPTTGDVQTIDNLAVPADTIIVYVGGRAFSGSEAGQNNELDYTSSAPTSPFEDQVKSRGKSGVLATPPTAYAPWGGSISFEDSHTDWYFGQDLSKIGPTQVDFATVAEHELGHLLGIGSAPSWKSYATPTGFTGPASEAANGGKAVPLDAGQQHWDLGVKSDGTWAAMTPISNSGRRTVFSDLDYAALKDIGWSVSPPPRLQFAGFTDGQAGTLTGPSGVIPNVPIPEYFADGSAGAAIVTVARSGPVDEAASVHYETFDGVANSYTYSPVAVAGTNYTPISGTLNFAPGETTKTFAVPITDDGSNLPKAVALALGDPSPGAGLGSLTTATLIIRATSSPIPGLQIDPLPPVIPPVSPGPTVVSALARNVAKKISVQVVFSSPLDPATASNPANYAVGLAVRSKAAHHKPAKITIHPIAVKAVAYSPASSSVTITLGAGITGGQTFQLRVVGGPGGLTGPARAPLGSPNPSAPGPDYSTTLVAPKPSKSGRH